MNNYTSEQLEEEAQRILQKIKVFEPSSKWQYRDALQLIHIGVILKNDFYMMRGKNFIIYVVCILKLKIIKFMVQKEQVKYNLDFIKDNTILNGTMYV